MSSQARYCLGGLAAILLYLAPAVITGEDHYVWIHDYLDSSVAHLKSMIDSGSIFDNSAKIPILCGVDRSTYLTPFDLKVFLFLLLPPYWATLMNLLLIKMTAFAGLFLLLTQCVLPRRPESDMVAFASALLFAFVPFYPDYGVSAAGVPLVAWAFAQLSRGRRKTASVLALVYYALYSWLALGGVFVCFLAGIYVATLWARGRKFPLWPAVGLFVLAAVYVAANWHMIAGFVEPAFVSHRAEFAPGAFVGQLLSGLAVLCVSQYHVGGFPAVLIIALFLFLWRRWGAGDPAYRRLGRSLAALAALILCGHLIEALPLPGVSAVRPERFFFIYPGICFAVLGFSMFEIARRGFGKLWKYVFAVALVADLAFDPFVTGEIGRLCGADGYPGFAQYYDEPLLCRLKAEAGLDDGCKVVSLGMDPAVAEYNGLACADGYIQQYPLAYKHSFARVIEGELAKSPELRDYFHGWGSRCYLFSSELCRDYLVGAGRDVHVRQLDIDCRALADLGCTHILSAAVIDNAEALGLRFVGEYSDPGSYWNIRVYSLL